MESNGFPMAVHLSAAAHEEALQEGLERDAFISCGERQIKGKGAMTTYLLRVGEWEEAFFTTARFSENGSARQPRRSI